MVNRMLNAVHQNSHLFTVEELNIINQNADLFTKIYTLSKVMENFNAIFNDDEEESEV